MTHKDIRDIAAYVGCAFSYDYFGRNPEKPGSPYEWQHKQDKGLNLFLVATQTYIAERDQSGEYKNLKLHLRKIESLTDEEKEHCSELAGHTKESSYFRIDSSSDLLFYDDLDGVISPCYNPGAIITYLQSISVYVPGTIDGQYVQLID